MAGILGQVPVGPVLFTGPCLDPFIPASKDFPYRTVRYCDQLEVVRTEDEATGQEGTRRAGGVEMKRRKRGAVSTPLLSFDMVLATARKQPFAGTSDRYIYECDAVNRATRVEK